MSAAASKPQTIRLAETFRNLFYTPIYAAISGGFFYRRGLNVMFSTMPAGGSVMDMLRNGEADIAQTGISRSLAEMDAGRDDAPLHIAEINRRDGFFLVSRQPAEGWSWKSLEGARLAPVGFTPVPWNSLRAAMLTRGVDLDAVDLRFGMSAADAVARFRAGELDCVHLPHPQARALADEGAGHVAAAVGPELGLLCYSSFAAMPSFIDANRDVAQVFVSGFADALRWLARAEDAEIAERAAPFFGGMSADFLARCIRQYRANRTWGADAEISRESFDNMRGVLMDGGMIRGRHAWERLVVPDFAAAARDDDDIDDDGDGAAT